MLVEVMFGLISMIGLFLLPAILRGTFPERVIVGYLGMPRSYHGQATLEKFTSAVTLGSLLTVAIILLIGLLCFRDAFKIIRKLRVSHQES
jgi:hypothetical protein